MRLLIFGFRDTVAEKIIDLLSADYETLLVDSSVADIRNFIYSRVASSHTHILGLGAYGGKDKSQIRIESVATSQFRNDQRGNVELSIPYFFIPNHDFKIAQGLGNSWCNLISYLLLAERSNVSYTFLHVSHSYSEIKAAKLIRTQLEAIGF